ncbi:MAG: AMP-binding protein [Burkholderiales bacterium]|nr:AMP-binding protein [Burkholderiales bacterium]
MQRDAAAWYTELRGKNAPLLVVERARREPDAVAYRAKHLGLYRSRTWREYAGLVARSARGLAALGLAPGERIAIMGDACEEWILCDLGAQALGAITYGIYPTASAAEVEYQMRDGGAAIFVAENQEYIDKILPYADALPQLRWIVVIDDSAMYAYDHRKLRTFAELYELGGEPGIDELERLARAVDPAAGAFIVYTSGTSGNPKGALIAHGAHLAAAANMVLHYPTLAERAHRTVAYLPLCHIFGRDIAVTLPLLSRMVTHFGESLEDLPQTLFEVAPTVLFTVPRYLQKFASHVLVGIAGTSPPEARCVRARGERRPPPRPGAVGRACGPRSCLRARAARGIPAAAQQARPRPARAPGRGGAPLPPDTMALWQIWGVNAMELYGQTETAGGIITGQRGRFPRPGSVGDAPPGWEVKLAEGRGKPRRDPGAQPRSVRRLLGATPRRRARPRARTAGCAPATSASGSPLLSRRGPPPRRLRRHLLGEEGICRGASCGSSTACAISSSPRAARRCRRPTSKTFCARARMSPRSW